jgi:hypothetical protein
MCHNETKIDQIQFHYETKAGKSLTDGRSWHKIVCSCLSVACASYHLQGNHITVIWRAEVTLGLASEPMIWLAIAGLALGR